MEVKRGTGVEPRSAGGSNARTMVCHETFQPNNAETLKRTPTE